MSEEAKAPVPETKPEPSVGALVYQALREAISTQPVVNPKKVTEDMKRNLDQQYKDACSFLTNGDVHWMHAVALAYSYECNYFTDRERQSMYDGLNPLITKLQTMKTAPAKSEPEKMLTRAAQNTTTTQEPIF